MMSSLISPEYSLKAFCQAVHGKIPPEFIGMEYPAEGK
jgi:hypothetical protein